MTADRMPASGPAGRDGTPRADDDAARAAGLREPPESMDLPESVESDPCAALARIAEERCALADRLRAVLHAGRTELRAAQRTFDLHGHRLDLALATADPRGVRGLKDAAHATFRVGRAAAHDHRELEAAATTWLDAIDRVNREVDAARRVIAGGQREAGRLLVDVEKRTVVVDAARIAADRADRACLEARGRLAACIEVAAGGAAPGLGEILGTRPALWGGEGRLNSSDESDESGASDEPDEAEMTALRRPDAHPAIVALLAGDTTVRDAIAAELAGDDATDRARWADRLTRLADAIVDVAVEDSRFVFPRDHPFWGGFSQGECHEIAVALQALGYRPRPGGGWIDDRAPTRRDFSLAVGYAGHDPMRLRHVPTEDDIAHLFDGTGTNVMGHLVGAAGGLTLGEMVALLGRRAEGFTDMWAEWGRVRPLLLREATPG